MAEKIKKPKKAKKQAPKAKPPELLLVAQSIEDSLAKQMAPYLKHQANIHEMLQPHLKTLSQMAELANRVAVEQQRALEPHLPMIKAAQEARDKMKEQIESVLKQLQMPQIMDEPKTFAVIPARSTPMVTDESAISKRIAEQVTGKIFDRLEISTSSQESSGARIGLKNQSMELLLNKDGDLYRDPKDKYCYRLRAAKARLKIIQLLTHDYTPTKEIKRLTNSNSNQAVSGTIAEINNNAVKFLGLSGKLIEGRQGSGYRLNQKYNIEKI